PFPGLWIRTETFEFLGRSCVALESAAPVCVVVASCVADCTPEPPPAWFPVCAVVALFAAVALEVALFDCETAPSSPGERIRTETFEFVGCVCVASDAAAASWVVVAFCVVDWTPPSPDGACCADVCVVGAVFVADPDEAASFACVAGAAAGAGAAVAACIAAPRTSPRRPDVTTGTAHPQALCVCVPVCVVAAVFEAFAVEVAVFDCETAPSLPGLKIRTETFSFDGAIWVALEPARAVWSVVDDCVVDCTGPAANAEPAVAAAAATVAAS